jgi:dienelactone hydrolase
MGRIIAIAVAASAWLTASVAAAAPLEAYAQLPLIDDVALSDDGTMIAIAMNEGPKQKILVRSVASMEGAQFIELGENRVGWLSWRDNDELAFGTRMMIYGPYSTMQTFRPHTYDVKNAKLDFNTPGRKDRPPSRWPYDDNNEPAVTVSYEAPSGRWNIRYHNKIIATGIHPFGPPSLLAKGKAPDTVLFGMDPGTGPIARELNLNTGEWSGDLEFAEDTRVFVDRQGELFGSIHRVGEDDKYDFLRKEDQLMWETLRKSFPKDQIDIVSWSTDHKVVVVALDSGDTPPAYVLVDLRTKKASFIANRWGGISKADIAPVRPISYKAADGLEIPGYLTLPNGREPRSLPLVVLVHGGPAARDSKTYDWWAQALASRGYAVLQSNFRGSNGYESAFQKAGFGEFGGKMQTDLSDGVRHLVKEGLVDPKRVCIMGASYGGYAALAGAAFDHGVYRCAAAFAGVSDLQALIAPDGGKGKTPTGRYFARYIGAEKASDKILAERSPAKHADGIDIPVLLVHGKDDLTVYWEQSQTMAWAMQKARKPVEFITLKGEDHNLRFGETRLQMLTAMVTFLEKHNPPN